MLQRRLSDIHRMSGGVSHETHSLEHFSLGMQSIPHFVVVRLKNLGRRFMCSIRIVAIKSWCLQSDSSEPIACHVAGSDVRKLQQRAGVGWCCCQPFSHHDTLFSHEVKAFRTNSSQKVNLYGLVFASARSSWASKRRWMHLKAPEKSSAVNCLGKQRYQHKIHH